MCSTSPLRLCKNRTLHNNDSTCNNCYGVDSITEISEYGTCENWSDQYRSKPEESEG
jgi:hypothetical protein